MLSLAFFGIQERLDTPLNNIPVVFNDATFIEGGVIWRWIKSTEYFILMGDDSADDFNDVRLILDLIVV